MFLVSECEPGRFGSDCVQTCDCDRDTPCDPVSGSCLCAPGKMGSRCDIGDSSISTKISFYFCFSYSVKCLLFTTDCGVNRFGPDCSEGCECHNGGQCDPRNGRCTCLNGWVGPSCQEGYYSLFTITCIFLWFNGITFTHIFHCRAHVYRKQAETRRHGLIVYSA